MRKLKFVVAKWNLYSKLKSIRVMTTLHIFRRQTRLLTTKHNNLFHLREMIAFSWYRAQEDISVFKRTLPKKMTSKMEKVIKFLVNCQRYNSVVHNRAMNNLSKTTTIKRKRLSTNQTKIPYKDHSTIKIWPKS